MDIICVCQQECVDFIYMYYFCAKVFSIKTIAFSVYFFVPHHEKKNT